MDTFAALDLHDALLKNVAMDWTGGNVIIDALVFRPGRDRAAEPCTLIWSGVRRLIVNRELPWGPSNFINSAKFEAPSTYEIEMQSGDHIVIEATAFALR
jgi:hypothetical protein